MLPEEDHGELHRLAGETRMAAADLMRLGLRWVLANRDVLERLPAAGQQTGSNSTYNDTDLVVALCVSAERPHVSATGHRIEWGKGRAMKSPVVKRSIVIAGHKTSVSLEDAKAT